MKVTEEEIKLTVELTEKINDLVFDGYTDSVQYSALVNVVSTFCVVAGEDREEADKIAIQFFDQLKSLIDKEDTYGIFHLRGRFK